MNSTTTFLRSTVLVLILAAGLQPDLLQARQLAGGTGTQADPYQVATATHLDNEQQQAGNHSVRFDARDLASGVYLYRLQVGGTILTKRLTLIK